MGWSLDLDPKNKVPWECLGNLAAGLCGTGLKTHKWRCRLAVRTPPFQGGGRRFESGQRYQFGSWCNGSTRVFGALSLGSSPSEPAIVE